MLHYPKFNTRVCVSVTHSSVDDCALCLQTVRNKQVFLTPCKHMFHTQCLRKWININRCPVTMELVYDKIKVGSCYGPCPMCRNNVHIPVTNEKECKIVKKLFQYNQFSNLS